MLFLSSERLNLNPSHIRRDCNNSPDYVHVPKSVTNGFWHSILKTMLLSEAWPEEFKLGIIRKHINHNSWNIYDNSHTPHNLLAAFHCTQGSVFSWNNASVQVFFTCAWLLQYVNNMMLFYDTVSSTQVLKSIQFTLLSITVLAVKCQY